MHNLQKKLCKRINFLLHVKQIQQYASQVHVRQTTYGSFFLLVADEYRVWKVLNDQKHSRLMKESDKAEKWEEVDLQFYCLNLNCKFVMLLEQWLPVRWVPVIRFKCISCFCILCAGFSLILIIFTVNPWCEYCYCKIFIIFS